MSFNTYASFLRHRHWEYDANTAKWLSPWLELEKGLAFFPTRPSQEEFNELLERFRTPGTDNRELKDELEKLFPDSYDLPRWVFKVEERVPYVKFSVDVESALDIAGFNEKANEAFEKWQVIEQGANRIRGNFTSTVNEFEVIARAIYSIWKDDATKMAMGWQGIHFGDVFKEPEIMQVVSDPVVWTRIDLRSSYDQRKRFLMLLELDDTFPERHVLQAEHLTEFTQKHRKELEKLKSEVEKGEKSLEDGYDEFDKIREKEEGEPEPKAKWFAVVNGREVVLEDGTVILRFDDKISPDDPRIIKAKSRALTETVKFIIRPRQGVILAGTEDGLEEIGKWVGGDNDEIVAQAEARGFLVDYSE